jgi:DNA polymerase III epsilon subunit family exonuclease
MVAIQRRVVGLSLSLDGTAARDLLDAVLQLARSRDPTARIVDVDAPWWERSFVAVDVETTGFSPQNDRVIELGWVRFEGGREVERQGTLLRVDREVPPEIRRITGIDDTMLEGAPGFREIADALVQVMSSVDFVVAYNARFDRSFLAEELLRAKRVMPDAPFVDPLVFVRQVDAYAGSKKLSEVAKRHGVSVDAPHRALADARAAGELLLRLAPRLPARTLTQLLDAQERWQRLPTAVPDEGTLKDRIMGLFR